LAKVQHINWIGLKLLSVVIMSHQSRAMATVAMAALGLHWRRRGVRARGRPLNRFFMQVVSVSVKYRIDWPPHRPMLAAASSSRLAGWLAGGRAAGTMSIDSRYSVDHFMHARPLVSNRVFMRLIPSSPPPLSGPANGRKKFGAGGNVLSLRRPRDGRLFRLRVVAGGRLRSGCSCGCGCG